MEVRMLYITFHIKYLTVIIAHKAIMFLIRSYYIVVLSINIKKIY